MISKIYAQGKSRLPVATILFALSCLVTTLPQYFLPEIYNRIIGTLPDLSHFYLFTLPVFSHTPLFITAHLVGNLTVILLFGSITEILLGMRRFIILSLTAFLVTILMSYFRGVDSMHGFSGVAWIYHSVVHFVLIVHLQKNSRQALKDPLFLIFILVFIYNFIGIAILEVIIMELRFYDNFGQVTHLASVVIGLPFVLTWRNQINDNIIRCFNSEKLVHEKGKSKIPHILLAFILLINFGATIFAGVTSLIYIEKPLSVKITPQSGTAVNKIGDSVSVTFSSPMISGSEKLIVKSLTTNSEDAMKIEVNWFTSIQMEINFSRSFENGEKVYLEFEVLPKYNLFNNYPVKIILDYQ